MSKKINLGAGNEIIDGYINHDISYHRPEIEQAWDLNVFPYPWQDDTFVEVKMWDVLEHLKEPLRVIEEVWRIVQHRGLLRIRTPGIESKHCWRDLTHRRPFALDSFDYFDPSTDLGDRCAFYSERKWHIVKKFHDSVGAVVVRMEAIKK